MSNDLFSLSYSDDSTSLFSLESAFEAAPSSLSLPDDDGPRAAPVPVSQATTCDTGTALDFRLSGDRPLATSWPDRARDNIAAIRLAVEIDEDGREATADEQLQLIRFIGFGATALANGMFRRPGETGFRKGWETLGQDLQDLVDDNTYRQLARCTQYAHFTPEPIVRAMWAGLQRLGFRGGRVLEPGIGSALFAALLPPALSDAVHFTGVELDPTTARIARLLQPSAKIIEGDFTRTRLPEGFDLAVGNPPFSDLIVRADPALRDAGLRLHDYFIVKSLSLLKPGGLAAFVTSTGTMNKLNQAARYEMSAIADLVGAFRLPEGTFHATAGTETAVDILFFRKRRSDEQSRSSDWLEAKFVPSGAGEPEQPVNTWFITHPECVLGRHATVSGPFGNAYSCLPHPGFDLAAALVPAIAALPEGICDLVPEDMADLAADQPLSLRADVREGSYFIGKDDTLMQVLDGRETVVPLKPADPDGIPPNHEGIIRKLIPIRDQLRAVLTAQELDRPWKDAQVKMRVAWSAFVREFGPVNSTKVTVTEDPDTGDVRETHRRLNLSPFQDDPDCWLVASIEDYDLDSNTARPGPIFNERVIAPPSPPSIVSAADALAVTLSELGRVDLDAIAGLLHSTPEAVVADLDEAIYRDPVSGHWQTADAYLSGAVRDKLAIARAAVTLDPAFERNIAALDKVQPVDLKPSEITARLGAPWIPAADVVSFVKEMMQADIIIHHSPELASWNVNAASLGYVSAGTVEWGTHRRHAGQLLSDALNSSLPQVFDTVKGASGGESRVLNTVETEAAKDKLQKIKDAFANWLWNDPDRADRLSRVYNDTYNNLVPRAFDGRHLKLPGASAAFTLYEHQKRVIWRIITSGSTYIAHAVGAGKTLSIAAAVMEQRRLGLINCAMIVVPGHCLAQAAREFLAMYPNARIIVADETNFAKDKRRRFLSRAATANWDAIIITHSAFKFIPVPEAFERAMIEEQMASYEDLITTIAREDRLTRKRIERMKEGLKERLSALSSVKDDLLTIGQIGVDQIIVDEAQEFRKLTFSTNMSALKGIDPNGSQRAWDLYVKSRFLDTRNPDRALVLASGTPITNTLGEMFTLQRFLGHKALAERGLHEFDAWAAAFGDTSTELELQPSGKYKPVTRFAQFVNVPELIAMFRTFADVVMPQDLRDYVKVPAISGGRRQIITAEPTPAFRGYQRLLASRIKAIEQRTGPPQPGDDILLSVITDGRHAAIDLRLVLDAYENEEANKLNQLVHNTYRVWLETTDCHYVQKDGKPFELTGAGQLIFSDLGTLAVEASRGFSAYRWIKSELVRLGVPADAIAFMQDFKKSQAKQRLFNDFNAGKVRILIGSSETMGTGVNVQLRLKALHHLDVPWLPSQIEQREGRIIRQGNQHDEVDVFAYATLGSMDATMWQNNERKAKFIAAALSGDASVRRLEDLDGGQANQFAMAKAIASGDTRLMQKAGLEAEIARLQRLRDAHIDEKHSIRRTIRDLQGAIAYRTRRISEIEEDLKRRVDIAGDAFVMKIGSHEGLKTLRDRQDAGKMLAKQLLMMVDRQWVNDTTIATIGGFDLVFYGRKLDLHDYHFETWLRTTGSDTVVELPLTMTPRGLIGRIEQVLGNFEIELEHCRIKLEHARSSLAGYEARTDQPFAFAADFELKLSELAAIDEDLARSEEEPLAAVSMAA